MTIPVRFPTKPPHPLARPFLWAARFYRQRPWISDVVLLLVAFLLMAAYAQYQDMLDGVMPK